MLKLITFVVVLFGIILTLEFITVSRITFPLTVNSDLVIRGVICLGLEIAKVGLFCAVGICVEGDGKIPNRRYPTEDNQSIEVL